VLSAEATHRCPSYDANHADSVVGVVGPDGSVGFLTPAIPVTPTLLASLRRSVPDTPVEARFRFSGTCQKGGCGSWREDHCGVIEDALEEHATTIAVQVNAPLAHCAIRSTCRWWAEHGRSACHACPLVHTASQMAESTSSY
jgi:hypothetical protein